MMYAAAMLTVFYLSSLVFELENVLTSFAHQMFQLSWAGWHIFGHLLLLVVAFGSLVDENGTPLYWDVIDFDLKLLIEQEVSRWLVLFGDLKDRPYSRQASTARAREVFVPKATFDEKLRAFLTNGIDGLKPNNWEHIWAGLDRNVKQNYRKIIHDRYIDLLPYADKVEMNQEDINELALRNNWKIGKARDHITRIREGGIFGLHPDPDPRRIRRTKKPEPLGPAFSTLSIEEQQEVLDRYNSLGPLALKTVVTNAELLARSQELGGAVSPRTLRTRHTEFKNFGLDGLTYKSRNHDGPYSVHPDMAIIIKFFRFSRHKPSNKWVYEQACIEARRRNLMEPTLNQVEKIIKNIPPKVLLISDGLKDQFRSEFRWTHDWIFPPGPIPCILQLDINVVPVLVKDTRKIGAGRTKSGETRMFLTTALHYTSRKIVAYLFTLDEPDRISVATVLYKAFLVVGRPDEVWVDNGHQFIAKLNKTITEEVGAVFHNLHPHEPQEKGVQERVYETFDQLWRDCEGYVGSNAEERNPNVKAKLAPAKLISKFHDYLEDKYHSIKHSEIGMPPNEYWDRYFVKEEVPAKKLASLLKERTLRKVGKTGIRFKTHEYWHGDMAKFVGEYLLILSTPYDDAPDHVSVFDPAGQWLCEAPSTKSAEGKSVTPREVADSQNAQLVTIQSEIKTVQKAFHDGEKGSSPTGEDNFPSRAEPHLGKRKGQKTPDNLDLMTSNRKKVEQEGGV